MTQTHDSLEKSPQVIHALHHALNVSGQGRAPEVLMTGLPDDDTSINIVWRICDRLGVPAQSYDAKLYQQLALSEVLLFEQAENTFVVIQKVSSDRFLSTEFTPDGSVGEKTFTLQDRIAYSGAGVVLTESSFNHSQSKTSSGWQSEPFSSWLSSHLWNARSIYRDVFLASILLNVFVLASPLFVMNVYDRVIPNGAFETLWVLATGLGLVFVFDLLVKLLRFRFVESTSREADVILSTKLFERVFNTKPEFLPKSVGAFANQFREFDAIKGFFNAASVTALIDLPFALLFFLVIYSLGGSIVWVPIVAAAIMIFFGFVIHFSLKKAVERSQADTSVKNSVLIEVLSILETLKLFNAEGKALSRWERSTVDAACSTQSVRQLSDSVAIFSSFVVQIAGVAVVMVGAYQIAEYQMSLGALIACVLLSNRALVPMLQVANLVSQYYQAKSAIKGLNELTALPREQGHESGYARQKRLKGDIAFENIGFAYDGQEPVLKDISFKVRAGEKVAVVGSVGSGKSTLLRLLVGLGTPMQGQIRMDGMDIRQINPATIRASLAYVPQDIELVSGTLRENVQLKNSRASDEQIYEALRFGGLQEMVKRNAHGLDFTLGEHGRGLSGGQRQGLVIARAMLGQPKIYLFDELTSAMDNQTEQQVISELKDEMNDATMIMSTHRASLLKLVDRIIVLDQGAIVADGPKDQVIEALKQGLISSGRAQ